MPASRFCFVSQTLEGAGIPSAPPPLCGLRAAPVSFSGVAAGGSHSFGGVAVFGPVRPSPWAYGPGYPTRAGAGGSPSPAQSQRPCAQSLRAPGNGNVVALIDASDGTIVAEYEYGPYGEPLRATGPYAEENPFPFSTKYLDTETGLYYYGFRYYTPEVGRFLNRDPLGESDGANLYGFVGNNPVNNWDYLGLSVLEGALSNLTG